MKEALKSSSRSSGSLITMDDDCSSSSTVDGASSSSPRTHTVVRDDYSRRTNNELDKRNKSLATREMSKEKTSSRSNNVVSKQNDKLHQKGIMNVRKLAEGMIADGNRGPCQTEPEESHPDAALIARYDTHVLSDPVHLLSEDEHSSYDNESLMSPCSRTDALISENGAHSQRIDSLSHRERRWSPSPRSDFFIVCDGQGVEREMEEGENPLQQDDDGAQRGEMAESTELRTSTVTSVYETLGERVTETAIAPIESEVIPIESAQRSNPNRDGSLLRLFQSEMFDIYFHMYYLQHRTEGGIHDYLVNLLYRREESDIHFYIPQLCCLCLTRYKTSNLSRFVLEKASKSMHLALKCSWLFQSATGEGTLETNEHSIQLTQDIEMAIVNSKPVPPGSAAYSPSIDITIPDLFERRKAVNKLQTTQLLARRCMNRSIGNSNLSPSSRTGPVSPVTSQRAECGTAFPSSIRRTQETVDTEQQSIAEGTTRKDKEHTMSSTSNESQSQATKSTTDTTERSTACAGRVVAVEPLGGTQPGADNFLEHRQNGSDASPTASQSLSGKSSRIAKQKQRVARGFVQLVSPISHPGCRVKLPSVYSKLGSPLQYSSFRDTALMDSEMQQFIVKQRRCDYYNLLIAFTAMIIEVSNKLALEPDRSLRLPLFKKFLEALNEWMFCRRCIVAACEGTFAMTGVNIPLSEFGSLNPIGSNTHSTQIVRFIPDECKVLSSKKRAPYLLVFEVADLDEDLRQLPAIFRLTTSEFSKVAMASEDSVMPSVDVLLSQVASSSGQRFPREGADDGDGATRTNEPAADVQPKSQLGHLSLDPSQRSTDASSAPPTLWNHLYVYNCILKELGERRLYQPPPGAIHGCDKPLSTPATIFATNESPLNALRRSMGLGASGILSSPHPTTPLSRPTSTAGRTPVIKMDGSSIVEARHSTANAEPLCTSTDRDGLERFDDVGKEDRDHHPLPVDRTTDLSHGQADQPIAKSFAAESDVITPSTLAAESAAVILNRTPSIHRDPALDDSYAFEGLTVSVDDEDSSGSTSRRLSVRSVGLPSSSRSSPSLLQTAPMSPSPSLLSSSSSPSPPDTPSSGPPLSELLSSDKLKRTQSSNSMSLLPTIPPSIHARRRSYHGLNFPSHRRSASAAPPPPPPITESGSKRTQSSQSYITFSSVWGLAAGVMGNGKPKPSAVLKDRVSFKLEQTSPVSSCLETVSQSSELPVLTASTGSISPPLSLTVPPEALSPQSIDRYSESSSRAERYSTTTTTTIKTDSVVPSTTAAELAANAKRVRAKLWGDLWRKTKQKYRRLSPYGSLNSWNLGCVLVKGGDDVRQEMLASQLVRQFKCIFEEARLPLYLRPYEILVIGANSGVMVFVPDTVSIDNLKKKFGTDSIGTLFDAAFADNPYEAKKNFIESHAAYSIVAYLLQVKDRHNGNFLLDAEGHVIHIDYGFMLSNCPGNVNFESSPFKLTPEFMEVLDGELSDNFEYFRTLVVRGFLEARKHAERLFLLVEMMLPSAKMPCFAAGPEATYLAFRERFMLNLTEEICIQKIVDLIDASVNNWRTIQYDNFQRITNGIV